MYSQTWTPMKTLHDPPPAVLWNKADHSSGTETDLLKMGSLLFLMWPATQASQ